MPPADHACETRDALLSRLSGQSWPVAPLLGALRLPTSADLLDIGAGQGHLLAGLRQRGHTGRLVGLDPAASARLPQKGPPGSGLVQGRAEHLPFPADTFDVVLMIRMLGHVQNRAQAVTEAVRVLRPGGQLILASNGADHLRASWAALGQAACEHGPDALLRDVLQGADLKAERLDIRHPVVVNQADSLQLAAAYGLGTTLDTAQFPLPDTLHLVVYLHQKGPQGGPHGRT